MNFPKRAFVGTNWGSIDLLYDQDGVLSCSLPRLEKPPVEMLSIHDAADDPYSLYVLDLLEGRKPERPKIKLPAGTPFQRKVWNRLLTIPWGESRTYGALARQLGCPRACRAVAGACGRNPVPLFIPCHRVVSAGGGLGGFSAGLPWKQLLLKRESQQSI